MNEAALVQRVEETSARTTVGNACLGRRYDVADRDAVIDLLSYTIGALYPCGREWLNHRLDDIASGVADAYVETDVRSVVGVVILTPKRGGALKMSTLFVRADRRGLGVGQRLVVKALHHAERCRYRETYVTVAHHLAGELAAVLQPYGFTQTAVEPDRYGPGRTEIVFARPA